MSKVMFHLEAEGKEHGDPNSGHSQPVNPRPHKLSPENVRRITDAGGPGRSSGRDSGRDRAIAPDSKVESLAAASAYGQRK